MSNQLLHIAHLVNPVFNPQDEELAIAQPITFESMRAAVENTPSHISIELLTAQYPEDHTIIPSYFRKTKDLVESVLDFNSFTHPRKLPLLKDLVERLYEETTAEFLIYTNVDIGLQPGFYTQVAKWITEGYDAFIINRRRISASNHTMELQDLYALPGLPHPGFDCFVFHRSLYPMLRFEKVCIGIPFVEIVFSQNLFCYAQQFRLFDKAFLTFHLGTAIFKKRDSEYLQYNRKEYYKVIKAIWPHLDNRKFPWGKHHIIYRLFKWALHPAIPIRLACQLEIRRWRNKL